MKPTPSRTLPACSSRWRICETASGSRHIPVTVNSMNHAAWSQNQHDSTETHPGRKHFRAHFFPIVGKAPLTGEGLCRPAAIRLRADQVATEHDYRADSQAPRGGGEHYETIGALNRHVSCANPSSLHATRPRRVRINKRYNICPRSTATVPRHVALQLFPV